jgi:antitoxin component of MazEF toxin-antitoxin module
LPSLVAQQKLVRNGNATAVTIPRTFLHYLRWLPGRAIVLELNDDCTEVVMRLPRQSDFGLIGPPSITRVGTPKEP